MRSLAGDLGQYAKTVPNKSVLTNGRCKDRYRSECGAGHAVCHKSVFLGQKLAADNCTGNLHSRSDADDNVLGGRSQNDYHIKTGMTLTNSPRLLAC